MVSKSDIKSFFIAVAAVIAAGMISKRLGM